MSAVPPGLFETMRVRSGGLPFVDQHLARLAHSAAMLRLPTPSAVLRTVALERAARGPANRVLRLGWSTDGAAWSEREVGPERPRRVVTVGVPHRPYPVKSEDRVAFDRALAEAEAAGGDEPLLLTRDGYVAETARFAVVWWDADVLCVPDPALGILPSLGLARLLALATEQGIPVAAGRYARAALDGRSVALVNAVRGIVPVDTLDGVQIAASPALSPLSVAFWPVA
jgi:branched-subunit amino acid aminotransferase/4-amino-4-deoxychorismate lyase